MFPDQLPSSAASSARAHLAGLAAFVDEHRDRLSALDLAAHLEVALDFLGWDRLDFDHVRRDVRERGAIVRVELRIFAVAPVTILVFAPGNFLSAHVALEWRGRETADYLFMTNGKEWFVFQPDATGAPFTQIRVEEPSTTESLVCQLRRSYHLGRHWTNAAEDNRDRALLEGELIELLSESSSFAQTISNRMQKQGLMVTARDVAAAVQAILETRYQLPEAPPPDAHDEIAAVEGRAGTEPADHSPYGHGLWPESATHRLARKGFPSFIRFEPDTGRATLLPGSVMRKRTGKSFPAFHQRLREDAVAAGLMRVEGDTLRVVAEFTLETPTTAATLVSGAVESGWSAWRDPEGNPIARSADATPRTKR